MSIGFERLLTPIEPDIVFTIGNVGIANSTLMIVLIALLFLCLGIFVVRKFTLIPGKFQSIVELVYEAIVGLVVQIAGNREQAEKVFPIIATILVYFVVANIIAIVPGLTDEETPAIRSDVATLGGELWVPGDWLARPQAPRTRRS